MKLHAVSDTSFDELACPYCHNQLVLQEDRLVCNSCKRVYSMIDGIPDFRERNEYWCSISREAMQKLNAKALESRDWLKTAKELLPENLCHSIEAFSHADAQFLWPITCNSRVLDAGAMWGALTIPVAQYCGEVFAVDKTMETLMLLKIRAEQMGFRNVHILASPLRKLPFPNDYFDLVILNGVLEWVPFEQEFVLDIHYGRKRNDSVTYSKNPRQIQLEVLREVQRVLKPGGHLHLAIENRFGYQYFAGFPDEHVNLKYVTLLPRFMANAISKRCLNSEYRTYTYSVAGYRSLFNNSGFQDVKFYGAFSNYRNPSEIIPLNLVKHWKDKVLTINSPTAPRYLRMAGKIFPGVLLKYLSPSFISIAKKEGEAGQGEARIVQLLGEAGLLESSVLATAEAVKCAGRSDNYYPANFMVYRGNEAKPAYFCKVCRDRRYIDVLENEANKLRTVNQLLDDTDINYSIPRLLYFGTIDNITFTVTQFIEGDKFNRHNMMSKGNLKKLDEAIQMGIRWLVKFQKYTRAREVNAVPYLLAVTEKQREILRKKGWLSQQVDSHIKKLMVDIKRLEGLSIPICAIHGDYELSYNLLFDKGKVKVVDWELFETEGLPFLDLATLIVDELILAHRRLRIDASFSAFIAEYNLRGYIRSWLELYENLSGVSARLLRLIGPIAALERKTKTYPYFRDPLSFPMWNDESFKELLSLYF